MLKSKKTRKQYTILELDSVLTFGRYEGETVEWIMQENPRFLKWLDESLKTHRLSDSVKELLNDTIANIPDTEEYSEAD